MLDYEQKLTVMYLCADTMRKEKKDFYMLEIIM